MKRFTDTDIWKKQWFQDLTPEHKMAWYYLKDMCDNVGIWSVNKRLADFQIGGTIDWDDFIDKCNGNIRVLSDSKWWIVDFCSFQYGELTENSTSKPIMSYIALLKKHNLWIGYTKGIHTLQDKDKDKDKEKVKDKDGEKVDYTTTDSIIDYFNEKTGKAMRHKDASREPIHARLAEGFTVDDCKKVIDIKYDEWRLDDEMEKYISIQTFFRATKFEKYLNQGAKKPSGIDATMKRLAEQGLL